MNVCMAQFVDQMICGQHQQIHPLLLADHADIAHQDASILPVRRIGGLDREFVDLRRRTHHKHIFGRHPAAPLGNRLETGIGGDGHRRCGKGQPFPPQHDLVQQPALAKLGLEQLGADIMVVEHIAHAPEPVPQRQNKDQIGRVAALDHVKAAGAPDDAGQPEPVPQRIAIFAGIGDSPGMRLQRLRMTPDMHVLDHLVGGVPAPRHRADHRDLIARLHQCRGLKPDPAVQRQR